MTNLSLATDKTPKAFNSKAQGRPEPRDGRTLGNESQSHGYAEGYPACAAIAATLGFGVERLRRKSVPMIANIHGRPSQ
jgi:hypothetical protein